MKYRFEQWIIRFYPGESLNFFSLIFQFYLVDIFLNNKFRWFGWEVVEYYSWSFRDRQNRDLMLRWVAKVTRYIWLSIHHLFISGTRCAPYFRRKSPATFPMWARQETSRRTMACVSSPRSPISTIYSIYLHIYSNNSNVLTLTLQNIINEKMYLAMWFWFIFMIIVNTIHTFYRVASIFFDKIRFYQIFKTVNC